MTVITRWLEIANQCFEKGNKGKKCIAVHCVAGLGRAPVLVAIALIEYGLDPLEAVKLIREKRRGAINSKQLTYLEHTYKKSRKGGCIVQ